VKGNELQDGNNQRSPSFPVLITVLV
jgi:hypothetical protein